MGLQVWWDRHLDIAGFMCTTTDWAFGPVFTGCDCDEEAEAFIQFVDAKHHKDLRQFSDPELESLKSDFLQTMKLCVDCNAIVVDGTMQCPDCRQEED